MIDKKKYTLVIGNQGYSAQGYLYIFIAKAHEYKQVEIRANKFKWKVAEIVIGYLKLNGWVMNEEGIKKESIIKWRCSKCGKSFEKQTAKCPICFQKVKQIPFESNYCIMERICAFEGQLDSVLENKKDMELFFDYLKILRNEQRVSDSIILRRLN